MQLAAELAGIVRPAWCTVAPVTVVDRDAALDEPLRQAAARLREASVLAGTALWQDLAGSHGGGGPERAEVTSAVRTMYKRVGLDPTKTRPSSEALLRRVRRGDELPRINSLVDVINWCSVESQLPFGLYDADRIQGDVVLRVGRPGEQYAGIRKDTVHVGGRLALADAAGPFGNPTSDSARTMVTSATTRALVVIFAPAPLPSSDVDRVLELTRQRIAQYCQRRQDR